MLYKKDIFCSIASWSWTISGQKILINQMRGWKNFGKRAYLKPADDRVLMGPRGAVSDVGGIKGEKVMGLDDDGSTVGADGSALRRYVGFVVGVVVGILVRFDEGEVVGATVGEKDGRAVGMARTSVAPVILTVPPHAPLL